MCGIAGILLNSHSDALASEARSAIRLMCEYMKDRGPDGQGLWINAHSRVFLGHRRLSVIDLNERSNQPMHSCNSRYTIVFNGEIYNFRELKKELEDSGVAFYTASDTEVLLCMYEKIGIGMLPKLRGMFAFAIFDSTDGSILLARDPYGIKPLYLACFSGGWVFASQVKAILSSNLIRRKVSAEGQTGFWMLGSVPDPYTWYEDVKAVEAGSFIKILSDGQIVKEKYFDISEAWNTAPNQLMSESEINSLVLKSVKESIQAHMVSDVPVGIFLSGGVDSCVLASMIADSGLSEKITAITVSFKEFSGGKNDEKILAGQIAKQYGIKHHIRSVSFEEFETDLPKIISHMDQPTIDGINTWFASKAASELGLKVVLSGIGGDELFYGYPSFDDVPMIKRISRIANRLIGIQWIFNLISHLTSNNRWRYITTDGFSLYGAYWIKRGLFSPCDLNLLMNKSIEAQGFRSISPTKFIKKIVGRNSKRCELGIGRLESCLYMRNQLLRDCDWASMAHSVELRTPLIDVVLLNQLAPILSRFKNSKGKKFLASGLKRNVYEDIVLRKKTGFSIPLGSWIERLEKNKESNNKSPIQNSNVSKKWAVKIADLIYS